MPILNLSQGATSKQSTFNINIYREVSWICGCEIRNAFFCFPCLLFNGEPSWSEKGVTDLGHLKEYIKRHCGNKTHINNVLNLLDTDLVNIADQLDSADRESLRKQNEQVEKNLDTLFKIIDCIKFCGSFKQALGTNFGFFDKINLTRSVDLAIQEHVENHEEGPYHKVFRGSAITIIKKDLLRCMLEVCQEEIKKQISIANYAAIIVEDTSYASATIQTALVLRYENSGEVYERFWSLLNHEVRDAETISQSILKEIDPLIDPEKLIAQSYDGAAAMSGQKNSVQAKISQVYNNARSIHCYAHELYQIMTQCASQIKAARVFFSCLSAVPAYFSRSPFRMGALNKAVARRNPTVTPIRFCYKTRVVNVVYENKDSMIECLEESENALSMEIIQKVRALRHYLEDEEFNFWLSFFYRIMPHVDLLSQKIQSPNVNSFEINMAVDSFVAAVKQVRDKIDDIAGEVEKNYASTSKRRKQTDFMSANAKDVCNLIISQARDRFEFVQYFDIAKLINSAEFRAHGQIFPEEALNMAIETYPTLNKNKLKTELSVLYDRRELRNIEGVLPLLNFMIDNNIEDTFEEFTKLSRILVTTPFLSGEAERCFYTLRCINNFLENCVDGELNQLNAFAMLALEKDLIKNIKDFNTRVFNKFVKFSYCRMDFIYKKKLV